MYVPGVVASLLLAFAFSVPSAKAFDLREWLSSLDVPGFRFMKSESKSLELVDLELGRNGQARLQIPKAYLTWVRHWSGGTHEFIKLAAHWPDLIPITLHREKHPIPIDYRLSAMRGRADDIRGGGIGRLLVR